MLSTNRCKMLLFLAVLCLIMAPDANTQTSQCSQGGCVYVQGSLAGLCAPPSTCWTKASDVAQHICDGVVYSCYICCLAQ